MAFITLAPSWRVVVYPLAAKQWVVVSSAISENVPPILTPRQAVGHGVTVIGVAIV